jgi:hypothetical protein
LELIYWSVQGDRGDSAGPRRPINLPSGRPWRIPTSIIRQIRRCGG